MKLCSLENIVEFFSRIFGSFSFFTLAGAVLKDVLMAEFSDETGCDEYLDDYEVEKMLDEQLMTE